MTVVEGRWSGSAQELHGRPLPESSEPQLWWFECERTSLVLGSTQSDALIDASACRERGIDIARRRSGGGLVVVGSGRVVWLDVLIPRRHALWNDDVSTAGRWLADAWARGLSELGVTGLDRHDGAMVRTRWSSLVCFDGRGPGELFAGDAKVVGVSQRRTRDWARFQCALSVVWDPRILDEVITVDGFDSREVATCAASTGLGFDDVRRAVGAAIRESIGA
ncbi:MAG: lipoyl protein ligase domain-containing protein [Actinomycetota bacterium]